MPSTQAHLLLGWELWLRFAIDCGAVEHEQATAFLAQVRTALAALVERTQGQVAAQEPAARFVKLLAGVLSTGKAHLLTMDGTRPADPERWGWHLQPVGTVATEVIWQPSRQHIGWLDGADVYLQPGAAYAAVRGLAQAEGTDVGLQPMALWKRLHQKGLLASREGDRNVIHSFIGGRQQGVLHLRAATLDDYSAPKSEKSEKSEEQGASTPGQDPSDPTFVPTLAATGAEV